LPLWRLLIKGGGHKADRETREPLFGRVLVPNEHVDEDGKHLANIPDDGETSGGDGGAT